MNVPPSLDDTQPGKPVRDPAREKLRIDGYDGARSSDSGVVLSGRSLYGADYVGVDARSRGMSGCMTLLILAFVGLIGVVIVVFAGLAGWTSGQRQASISATATQNAAIQEQLARIPGDVAAGNPDLLQARIEFLATLTPGVPQVPALWTTATALSAQFQPTVNPTDALTVPPTVDAPSTSAPTLMPTLNATDSANVIPLTPQTDAPNRADALGLNLDVNALLIEAQGYAATSQWQDAIETLDVIVAVDPDFQTANVRALMIDALASYALQLYNAGHLAGCPAI